MNPFEDQLIQLGQEAGELQKAEIELKAKAQLFNQKMIGFLKEQGLSDDFTLPQLALLSIRKSRG